MSVLMKRLIKIFIDNIIQNDISRYKVYSMLMDIQGWKIWVDDPYIRNYRSRLKSLRNKYAGHRCFIMGNGPSLNETPLELLSNEYVWGVNRCYLLFDRIKWRPHFYIAIDTRVVPDNTSEIMEYLSEFQETRSFFPIKFRLKNTLNSKPNIFWYRDLPVEDSYPEGHFSTKVNSYVREARTVTIAAMQIAVYLGFNPIYLIGCDTSYTIPKSAKFEDEKKDFIISTSDDDPNHFSPQYFGSGKKYHQPYPDRMIFAYKQAKVVCDMLDVDVYNATYGGNLEVFPRISFPSLF